MGAFRNHADNLLKRLHFIYFTTTEIQAMAGKQKSLAGTKGDISVVLLWGEITVPGRNVCDLVITNHPICRHRESNAGRSVEKPER